MLIKATREFGQYLNKITFSGGRKKTNYLTVAKCELVCIVK